MGKYKADPTKSFVFQTVNMASIDTMSDETAGKLIKAVGHWVINGFDDFEEVPETAVGSFAVIRKQILQDKGKWLDRCEQNKQNILSRWEKEKAEKEALENLRNMSKNTNVYERIQTYSKDTDKDIDKDIDKDKYINSDNQTDEDILEKRNRLFPIGGSS